MEFFSRLEGVRRSGDEWVARCPAHPDHNPSLSIREMQGKLLLHCHAGCTPEAVCAAAGIEARELFADSAPAPRIGAVYGYLAEGGQLLFEVLRYEPKAFRQRRPNGNGGWVWNLKGVPRVLYRLPEVQAAKSVLVVEGEKDAESGRKMGLTATCNPCGAGKWREEYSETLRGKRVAVIADVDESGRKHAEHVAQSLCGKAASVKVLELPGAKDLSEWAEKGGTREALLELIRNVPEWTGPSNIASKRPLIVLAVEEFLTREIKPREMLLNPILPEQGLAMLYSWRGTGKTFLALGIGAAIASGTHFLRWTAPRPRNVLYIDGEMPAFTMRERSAMILAGTEGDGPEPGALKIITPDVQDRPMPDLATPEGQYLIEPHLAGVDLIILDNLSALCRSGDEDKREGWLPVQEWCLKLRRQGISVLLLHHSGKGKQQRGASAREDLLDTVFTLKHPKDYSFNQGLRCEVHFEKTRSMLGDAAKPFEARMESGPDGRAIWTWRELEDAKAQQAASLYAEGVSVRDVANELEISKSQAGRLRKLWELNEREKVSQCPAP
jgi:putative DNA primase/helicase